MADVDNGAVTSRRVGPRKAQSLRDVDAAVASRLPTPGAAPRSEAMVQGCGLRDDPGPQSSDRSSCSLRPLGIFWLKFRPAKS
jgi:hypothetical protein